MLGFILWSVMSLLFVGLAIRCRKSETAFGFFTFVDPPVVNDVKGYNRAVSILWWVSGAVYELLGVPMLFLERFPALIAVVVLGTVIGLIVMMLVYTKIADRYQ